MVGRGPDRRFYETLPALTLAEVAALTGARLDGAAGTARATAVASLAAAGPESLAYCADSRHAAALATTAAGACLVTPALRGRVPDGCAALVCSHPQAAWSLAAGRLHRLRRLGEEESAISPAAHIEEAVAIGPGVAVGPDAQIGRGSVIGAGAVIGPGVAIGRDCDVGPGVSIFCALIGDGVRIWAGARIGEAGFGVAEGPAGLVDTPQLGRVILQDRVTVGANSCIDRGALDDTVIGENTKIDNLVQVAHNVRIGRNCILAAYAGISGSVEIGDGSVLGGRVGVADHLVIGAGVRIAAASGVMSNIPAGETWAGYPARPRMRWLREVAFLGRLAARDRRVGGPHERSGS